MLKCSSCGRNITIGGLCPACARVYCQECSPKGGCPFHKLSLVKIKVENQEFGDKVVQWVSDDSGRKIGISDFDELPRNILFIPETLARQPKLKFILSPNKKNSVALELAIGRTIGFKKPEYLRKAIEESRYAVLLNSVTNLAYVLLNAGAIPDAAVMKFLTQVVSETTLTVPDIAKKFEKPISKMFLNTLKTYNAKFETNAVHADESLKTAVSLLIFGLSQDYAEYEALKKNITEDTMDAASQFISYKLDLIPKAVKWRDLGYLLEVYNLLGRFTEIFLLYASTKQSKPLLDSIENRKQEAYKRFKEKVGKRTDLQKAIKIMESFASNDLATTTPETWIEAVKSGYENAFQVLFPKYVWLLEIVPFIEASQEYLHQLDNGIEPSNKKFGTIDNFISLLTKVFRSDVYYKEIPIMAGNILVSLLTSMLRRNKDETIYESLLTTGQEYSKLLERNVKLIQKANPGSPASYFDSVQVLISLSMWSRKFGKSDQYKKLILEAKSKAVKYNLVSLQFMLNWLDFLVTHDYDDIQRLANLAGQLPQDKFSKIEKHMTDIGFLSTALLEKEHKFENLDKALDSSITVDVDHPFSGYEVEKQLHESTVTHFIIQIFYFLELADTHQSESLLIESVNQAVLYAKGLSSVIEFPATPESVFVLKTLALSDLILGNVKLMEKNLQLLDKFDVFSKNVRDFAFMLRQYGSPIKEKNWKALSKVLEIPVDLRDPWMRIARKTIETKLGKEVSLFPSKFVFVEGKSDKIALMAFAKHLNISLEGVEIVPIGGMNKARFYLRSWTSNLGKVIPFFVIFDSNAKDEITGLVSEGLLGTNYHLWSDGNIEDYYPHEILRRALKELDSKYGIGLPIDKLMEKIESGTLSPDNIALGNKIPNLKTPWKIALAEAVAKMMLEEKNYLIIPEIANVLRTITVS